MQDLTNDELLPEYIREIKQLSQKNVTIKLVLAPGDAMALIATIQLACRHPSFLGLSSQIARRIADRMQSEFLQYSVWHVLEVIRRGWEPQYDEHGGKTSQRDGAQ